MTGWGTRSLCYCQPSHPPSQSTLKFSQFSHIYITIIISAFICRHFIFRYTRFSIFIISFNNVLFPPFASTIFGSFFIFKTCTYFFITRTNRAILTISASTSRSTCTFGQLYGRSNGLSCTPSCKNNPAEEDQLAREYLQHSLEHPNQQLTCH